MGTLSTDSMGSVGVAREDLHDVSLTRKHERWGECEMYLVVVTCKQHNLISR